MALIPILPASVHAASDYAVSSLLVAAPHKLGFPRAGRGNRVMRAMAAGNIAFSAITDHEYGILRLLPMKVHKAVHLGMDTFLMLSPWLLGFKTGRKRSWLPYVVVGAAGVAAMAFTRDSD